MVGQPFPPFAKDLQDAMTAALTKPVTDVRMLSHYTRIGALRSILEGKELWFTHSAAMNDVDEVRAGAEIVSRALAKFGPTAFTLAPFAATRAIEQFEEQRQASEKSTYIFSLSDHGRFNEADRVQMWALYGKQDDALCLVLKKPAVLEQSASGLFPAKWVPINYATPDAVENSVQRMFEAFEKVARKYPEIFGRTPPLGLGRVIAICAMMPVLAHKSTDFEFEQEIRFLHTPPTQFSPLPAGAEIRRVQGLKGERECFVLPLRKYPEYGVDASIENLLDHIIVAPSSVADDRVREVCGLLDAQGLAHVPVRASGSSFRVDR